MSTQVAPTFARLERRTEQIVAVLRLLALCVLALVFWLVGVLDPSQITMVPFGGLLLTTLIGLVVARRRLFLPWVPWVLATLDVLFLSHCLVMIAMATGQPLQAALDTPAASVVFVFLATAAVRHRPLLILYTGGLFVVLWAAVLLAAPLAGIGLSSQTTITTILGRLAIIGLVTFALFVVVTRARRTLTRSLLEANRRANLSRYFSPQVVDEIANASEPAPAFQPQSAAIMFADLRGFTSLAETMTADRVAEFLNDYRRRISDPIVQHHGTIDKFIGDGVMAIFGVPEPGKDDARNAVLGGLAVVDAMERWSNERRAEGLPSLRIGVGIHYGNVIAGPLGDDRRLEYTAIGDTVNTAARIERLTADLGEPLLLSGDVLASVPNLEQDLPWIPLAAHVLRGRRQPIQIYRPDWSARPALLSGKQATGAA